jgi:hypothetical protein
MTNSGEGDRGEMPLASSETPPTITLGARFSAAIAVLRAIPTGSAEYDRLGDDDLLAVHRLAAEQLTVASELLAITAGQIDHRSAPELGTNGLARRYGYRTPIEMVKVTSNTTGTDAGRAVRAGRIIRDTHTDGLPDAKTGIPATPAEPWLAPVGVALTEGLTPAGADAIRSGLGTPTATVTEAALAEVAARLCEEATTLDPDRLFRLARRYRDELDLAAVGDREEERRGKRSLKLFRLPDGMGRLVWILDPETLALVTDVYDRATSPRRGGPRIVDTQGREIADRILADVRTTDQLASDVFSQLLQHGTTTDPNLILGTGTPTVRMLAIHLPAGGGVPAAENELLGWIEGQSDPVSSETIQRNICTGATTEIFFSRTGQPLDIGREQRLFTAKQKSVLAARDGGCRWGTADGHAGCDRPPSWCESHHVEHWKRDHGLTDINNGVLLCKYHHMLLHNHGWEITRDGATFWLIPPGSIDPDQTPRLMPSMSFALNALLSTAPTEERSESASPAGQHTKKEPPRPRGWGGPQ